MIMSLASDYYTDPDIYRQERENIFRQSWWLLGPASECAAAGDYLSDVVCGWPLFAIRAEDGELRGFHNVCRHRASTLLEAGGGNCSAIRCPYHGWLYNNTGELLKTPKFGEDAEFDRSQLGLFPVRVDTWRDMVFVCLSEQAPGLAEWLGSLPGLYEKFPSIGEMDYHGKFVVEGQANWKTYCDNTVEGYHLHSVHPRLAKAVADGAVEIVPYDDGALIAFHVNYGVLAGGAQLRGDDGLWTYKFPGFQIAASDNAFKIERVEACGVARLISTNWAWYRNLTPEQRVDSFDWSRTVVEEDIGICEKVQTNLQAGVFVSGPLSPVQESNVALFQSHYSLTLDTQ